MLEGVNVNLRVAEKEDVKLLTEWFNDVKFVSEFQDFPFIIVQFDAHGVVDNTERLANLIYYYSLPDCSKKQEIYLKLENRTC